MKSATVNDQPSANVLILASQSPRRKQLLAQLGYQFTVQASDIDECILPSELAYDYVLRLAKQKALHVFDSLNCAQQKVTSVLGSDTCVVLDNKILGKPRNEDDCIATLSSLSNRQHQVLTAIALVNARGLEGQVITTEVTFKVLSKTEIQAYWLTGEPQDKAGSYGIQGIAGQFVKTINGSYSAVVGLPLYETAQLLNNAGYHGAIVAK
jgi:septum formation protein